MILVKVFLTASVERQSTRIKRGCLMHWHWPGIILEYVLCMQSVHNDSLIINMKDEIRSDGLFAYRWCSSMVPVQYRTAQFPRTRVSNIALLKLFFFLFQSFLPFLLLQR